MFASEPVRLLSSIVRVRSTVPRAGEFEGAEKLTATRILKFARVETLPR